ncbi:MAG TPA: PQQ-dependent sugar dehydrogenase [Solirubrobacterales bacterium]|nr:PQQ-dependent sugar dehydrogenase [Solirubrobacterales bacterium]
MSYLEGVLRVLWKLMAGAILSLSVAAGTAHALTLQQIGAGFDQPIYVTSDPGNPDRLFVVERKGTVVLLQNGEVKPFADISGVVSCCDGERGLLSIALSPDFDSSGRFFLDYTDGLGAIHVAEMLAGGDAALSSSLRDVIPPIPHPEESNHYGGQLQFGPEGALFISTGDGGGGNDKHHNAQNPSSKLGKILRLSSPGPLKQPEVWSLGLRNPFRFSFDRSSGDLWIGDVGEGEREEVDFATAPGLGHGFNYGWNCLEGSVLGPSTDEPECAANAGKFVPPVFEYTHPVGGEAICGGAIIGGYVVRGPGMGDLFGRYLYGDFCNGNVRSFSPLAPALTDRSEVKRIAKLTSFGEDACGRLYASSEDGPVYRLVGPETAVCPSTANPVYNPAAQKALAPAFVGIRAVSRKVSRHRRGLITAWVTPCKGRRGDPVTLWRGRRNLGTRYLDRACSVRFRPRIDRRSSFRVTVRQSDEYLPAISRKLTIKPVKRHR